MTVTSITPAIKVVKESGMMGCDMYIAYGDKIRVTDIEGNEFVGEFLYMELGTDEEEDDALILDVDGKNVAVQSSWVVELEEAK